MMKKFINVIVIIGIVVLISCTTSKNSSAPVTASISGSAPTTTDMANLDGAIQLASDNINNLLASGTKVALLNFASPSDVFSDYVLEEMSIHLVNGRKLVVVDRKEINLIFGEMKFQMSGHVSDESAQEIGKMLGAQSIISGSLVSMGDSYRFRTKAINVNSATIEASSSFSVKESPQIRHLLAQRSKTSTPQTTTAPQKENTSSSGSIRRNGAVYNPDGIELVYVEGKGSGIMAIKGFYIGKFEITQAQWQAVMGNNPSHFKGANLPVEMVSWHDVQEFLARLNRTTGRNYRLPTEAEWEFAARGGINSKRYEYSGSNNINNVTWYKSNSGDSTQPVGTKQANELGIHDMSGNVWEWSEDAEGSKRVIRGGSWFNTTLSELSVAGRYIVSPSERNINIGFRVVLP